MAKNWVRTDSWLGMAWQRGRGIDEISVTIPWIRVISYVPLSLQVGSVCTECQSIGLWPWPEGISIKCMTWPILTVEKHPTASSISENSSPLMFVRQSQTILQITINRWYKHSSIGDVQNVPTNLSSLLVKSTSYFPSLPHDIMCKVGHNASVG